MYLWSVKRLIEDIRLGEVTETQYKNYYIASSLLVLFGYLMLNLSAEIKPTIALASFVLQLGLLVSWVNAIFKANGGEQGKDFLKRVIALYLPVAIQTMLLFIAIGIVIEVVFPLLINNMDENAQNHLNSIKDLIFEVIVSTCIYWRIHKAIKLINI